MASVKKRGEVWRARFRDDSGREHARHFPRKVDAQRWLDEQTAAVVTGQFVDPRAGRLTVGAYAAQWQAAQVGSDGTARIIDNALRLHVLPKLGQRHLHAVRRSDIQALVRAVSETLAPGSVRNVYDVTARLFAAAVDDRLIASSPCRSITLPRQHDVEVVPLSVEDVRALVDAAPARYRAAVVLLAGSGLRIGEALGLEVGDVDFLRRTVRVERQRRQDGVVAATKTARSVRTVPLAQVVVDELAAHLAAYGTEDRGALFTAETDEALTYRQWKLVWASAATSAGVDGTTHDLRHFYASALIAGGASVKTVQTLLGHASPTITLRTYAHLWPGEDDRTRALIDATLSVLRTDGGLTTPADGPAAGQ